MPRAKSWVSDMEIDEISLVDRPANALALVRIAKRATQEDAVPDQDETVEIFDEDGEPVDATQLEFGDIVYDQTGQAYELQPEQDEQDEPEEAFAPREYATLGKSSPLAGAAEAAEAVVPKFFTRAKAKGSQMLGDTPEKRKWRIGGLAGAGGAAAAGGGYAAGRRVNKSFADEVREELSKAVTESDRDEVIAKALDEITKADARAARAEEMAKSERDLRLQREYIAKAADYNMPIPAEELGPVLMRCADALSYEDCAVLHKALSAAGDMLYTELGFTGENDNADPLTQIDAELDAHAARLAKSARGNGQAAAISKAEAMTEYFTDHPEAYEQYQATRNGR